jgi:hypothetical protein
VVFIDGPPRAATRTHLPSFVKLVVVVVLLEHHFECFVEVFLQYDVPVLAHGLHAGLQANARDLSAGQLVGACNEALEVNVVSQAHFRCAHAKDKALLTTVWDGELDLSGGGMSTRS